MARPIHPVIVGTAGHIDHGKSSLVRGLTGVDPDRLKEEKLRGLTIDLGFAALKLPDGRRIGMVDVPGHERFVRNMVAGSTSMDLALVVVAADDGVMPQTREHVDILRLLGVTRGLVALTKVDLVDPELVEVADEEVGELMATAGFGAFQRLRVSNTTGEGLDELKAALIELALATPPRPTGGHFRMPLQRVFQLDGIGTVVTGIPAAGELEVGGSVEFLPGGHVSKVRALHAYGGKIEHAVAGHSLALSVPDARDAGLRRGHVACQPGIFNVGDALDVDLTLLERAPNLRHRDEVRCHVGTAEALGRVLLLDRDQLRAEEQAVARVELEEEVCCAPGDRFLLRLQNPVVTIGGGSVLRLATAPRRYRRKEVGSELERLAAAGSTPEARIREELASAGPVGRSVDQLAQSLALDHDTVDGALADLDGVVVSERARRAFLADVLDAGVVELLANVDRMLKSKPMAASIQRASIRPTRVLPRELQDAVFERLQSEGRVRTDAQGRVLFVDRLAPLDAADRARVDAIIDHCRSAGFRPPTRVELAAATGETEAALEGLLARAIDEAGVTEVGDHVYGAEVIESVLRTIATNCGRHEDTLDIPELRDELGTSRKYLIPLLEHVDSLGLTRLRGGVRILLRQSDAFAQL